jgi:hypothetical protein
MPNTQNKITAQSVSRDFTKKGGEHYVPDCSNGIQQTTKNHEQRDFRLTHHSRTLHRSPAGDADGAGGYA